MYPYMKLRRFLKYVNAEHKGPELQNPFNVMRYKVKLTIRMIMWEGKEGQITA